MGLKSCLVAVGILLLLASPAGAELTQGQWLVGAGGGLLLPTGDYHDIGKTGYNLGLRASYLIAPEASIGLDLGYNRNDIPDNVKSVLEFLSGTTVDGHYKVMQYTAQGTLYLAQGQAVRPYFTAGGGLYHFKLTLTESVPGYSASAEGGEDKGGIFGGAGVIFPAGSSTHIGIEATYHDIFTEGSSITYANVRALVMFSLGKK